MSELCRPSNVIRIKRRVTGLAGAPSALKSAELAHNEVDDTLYVGKGDDGAGNATSVVPLAGKGAFVVDAKASVSWFRSFAVASSAAIAHPPVRRPRLGGGAGKV